MSRTSDIQTLVQINPDNLDGFEWSKRLKEKTRNETTTNEQEKLQKELSAGNESAPQEQRRKTHARRHTAVDRA